MLSSEPVSVSVKVHALAGSSSRITEGPRRRRGSRYSAGRAENVCDKQRSKPDPKTARCLWWGEVGDQRGRAPLRIYPGTASRFIRTREFVARAYLLSALRLGVIFPASIFAT